MAAYTKEGEIYGRRPDKISRTSVSATDTQKDAIKANIGVLEDVTTLSEEASSADLANRIKRMEQAITGYSDMTGQYAKLASDWMAGNFTGGDKVANQAAARGFNLGFDPSDTQFVNFGELQTYGMEVVDMQKQGMAAYSQLTSDARELMGNPMSVTSMFTTPDKVFSATQSESDRNAEIASYNSSLQAMPDAAKVAREDELRMSRISGVRPSGFTGYAQGGSTNPFFSGDRYTGSRTGALGRAREYRSA